MLTPIVSRRFYRRLDLSPDVRMRIASIALYFSAYGTIQGLSDKYSISRQFIYDLRDALCFSTESIFGLSKKTAAQLDKTSILAWLLSLRLEGKSSIEGISLILKRFDLPYNSVGFISQELTRIGLKQGHILHTHVVGLRVVFCSDEIFSKGQAILMTVDPVSLCILSIELSENRKGETWAAHWQRLLSAGYMPLALCNDEGSGMARGQEQAIPQTVRQSDTFHAVSHRLGLWVERLETKAFKAIEAEYERFRLFENSKTDDTFDKRDTEYTKARQEAQHAIALFDAFNFLYHCLLSPFQLFDNQGQLKNHEMELADFDTALDLIKALGHKDINKEIKSIENCKKDLFLFMSVAKQTVEILAQHVPIPILKTLSLAWQTHKNAIKAKQTKRKQMLKRKEVYMIDQLKAEQQSHQIDAFKERVYGELNKIIQSSAAVECVNSILRPYLNASKNQVSQATLNLFMAYHNHRRFKAGERKGKIPFEILTGQIQEKDWLDLMLLKAA